MVLPAPNLLRDSAQKSTSGCSLLTFSICCGNFFKKREIKYEINNSLIIRTKLYCVHVIMYGATFHLQSVLCPQTFHVCYSLVLVTRYLCFVSNSMKRCAENFY